MSKQRGIILDWGWTVCNTESGELFPEVADVVQRLSQHSCRFVLVSLVGSQERLEERFTAIRSCAISSYLEHVFVGTDDKFPFLNTIDRDIFGPSVSITYVVDDRYAMRRALHWAKLKGGPVKAVRTMRGPHMTEDLSDRFGSPDYTIENFRDLEVILRPELELQPSIIF